jgi:hypothetical protein
LTLPEGTAGAATLRPFTTGDHEETNTLKRTALFALLAAFALPAAAGVGAHRESPLERQAFAQQHRPAGAADGHPGIPARWTAFGREATS